jgi:hypothetical protein
VAVWEMNGATIIGNGGLGAVPSNWFIVETGDFNADGMSDILWRDTAGDVAMWFMNGLSLLSPPAGLGNVSNVWTIQNVNAD